jgi:hypothetical protein
MAGKLPAQGPAPYGYAYIGQRRERSLVINPDEAAIVVRVYEAYHSGLSMLDIARALSEERVPTRFDTTGRKKVSKVGFWGRSIIKNILGSRVYTGVWHVEHMGVGKDIPVPVIIDPELWEQVRVRRAQGKPMSRRNTKYFYLLGRRITCAQCGYSVQGGLTVSPAGKEYFYYDCIGTKANRRSGGLEGKVCDLPRFRVDITDERVWNGLLTQVLTEEAILASVERQQARWAAGRSKASDERESVSAKIGQLSQQIAKLVHLARQAPDVAEIAAEIATVNEQRAALQARLEALASVGEDTPRPMDAQQLVVRAQEVLEEIRDATAEERRFAIDRLDVRVRLAVEGDERVAYLRCAILPDEFRIVVRP